MNFVEGGCVFAMCGTSGILLVGAVPLASDMGISEDCAPFWLNRIFGSGRKRKTSTSRDIGTSITEQQLLLESPPSSPASWLQSPASPARGRLPDLVTSCDATPAAAATSVFVFPDVSVLGAELAQPSAVPAAGPSAELLQRLAWPLPPPVVGRRRHPAGDRPSQPAAADAAAEAAQVGGALRRCADQLELSCQQQQLAPAQHQLSCSLETAAACGIACIAAGCVCYKLCK